MKRVKLGITWIGVALTMIITNFAVNVENADAAKARFLHHQLKKCQQIKKSLLLHRV